MSHLLHHDAIFTQTRKTQKFLYLTHTLHSHTLVWFSLRLSLGLSYLCLGMRVVWVGSAGLSYLCLGLLVIRSPLRPFFFTSLFRFIISLSRSSRSSSTYN
ncbi:unnamed protein product [Rhizophagus irregularis]|nr:unnamed protein product [Rhizophagus irregularis]